MGKIGKLFSKVGILAEFLSFLWQKKLWWMIPMIIVLVLFGMLFIFTQSSAVAPFIYSLF